MVKAIFRFVPIILGYAMVLASQEFLLNAIGCDWRYLIISVLFSIGYALVYWKGETE